MTFKQEDRGWKLELTELTFLIEIGKTYRIENDAVVSKTDGNGFDGTFRTLSFSSIADLCTLQGGLTAQQCLIAGTSCVDYEYGRLGLYTEGCHERTKQWFPEPWCHALVTCDIDRTGAPQALQTYMGSAADVARLFFEVVPQIRGAALLVRPSSSNGVCYPDGSPAKAGGWHVHLIAPPGMRVVIMERLYAAFARAGFGWIMVSAFPCLLKRNPVDTALLIPNQPIYSGPPRVQAPLILSRPGCFLQEGCAFDPDWLPDDGRQEVEHIYDELKKAPELQVQMDAVIDRKAEAAVPASTPKRSAVVSEVKVKIRKQIEEVARGFLFCDFPITLYNGPTVTVAQILADPYRYHRSLTLTPGEEDYRDGAQTGIVYVSEHGVKLHTQAHGGITYTLLAFDPDKMIRHLIGEQKPKGPLPPEDAKRQLRAALATWPHETRSLAVKATQGLGKTREVLERMADNREIRFLFLAANLKQCQQVYDEYCALYNGVDAALCRGRSAPDPESESAAMCTQPARCEDALARGATSLSTSACLKCPHFDTCGYQKQAKQFGRKKTAPRIIFAAHDYAHYSLPGGWAPDALVLDEMLRTGGVDEEINTPAADITLQERLDPTNALVAHSMSGSALDWTDPAAIKAHRYKGEVLQAMASGAQHYAINDRWVVPKYRKFAHDDIPVLVIDGTLRQDLLELQLRQKFEVVQTEARRNVILIQVVGNDAGSGASTTAFTKGTSEPVKRYLSNLPRDWCLFTYKAVRSALERDDDPACGHFSGDIRGSNRFKAYQTSLVYGRLQIPELVAVGRARVLAEANGLPAPSGKMEWIEQEVQTTYAGKKIIKYLRHTDPLVQSIIESEREDEIEQAVDRLRPVWHEGEPKVAVVVNNLPPTIRPDFVLDWADVRDGRAAPPAMHATLTGLTPGSPEQGPMLRPDLWINKSSARNHMKAQLKPNWMDWFKRLKVLPVRAGKRRQAVDAFYRPADCIWTAEYLKLLNKLPPAKSPKSPYIS